MSKLTRAQQIKQYNELNPSYNITRVKRMTREQIASWRQWSESDLYELYQNPSYAKRASWSKIFDDYNPSEVLGVCGNSMAYSVILRADNGDLLHITRDNNYLIELKEA